MVFLWRCLEFHWWMLMVVRSMEELLQFPDNFWWSIKAMERSWIQIYTCCHTRYPISLCIVAEKQGMSSCYIISYHIISHHITSYHIISYHIMQQSYQKSCPSLYPPTGHLCIHIFRTAHCWNAPGPQNRDGHLPTIHFQMHGKTPIILSRYCW